MQARYYDPVIGRFLGEDPMTMLDMDMNPGYFNRYAYTMNNPINLVDPTGMYNCSADDCEQVDKYVSELAKARDDSNTSEADQKSLSRVLDALGPKGEKGSVLIQLVTNGGSELTNENTITLNTGYTDQNGNEVSRSLENIVVSLSHEGSHLASHHEGNRLRTLQDLSLIHI